MDIVHEVPWEQGKEDFDRWKSRTLASLSTELQARYSSPGQAVRLKGSSVEIRRGATWGFDVSISLKQKAQEDGKKTEIAEGQAPSKEKGAGVVEFTVAHGCRIVDKSDGFAIGTGLLTVVVVAFYYIRHLFRSGISAVDVKSGWAIPLVAGGGVAYGLHLIILRLVELLGSSPERQEYEKLMDEVRSLTRIEGPRKT